MRVYFDKFGCTVSEEEATDFRGMLKDGFGIRHHISMMDSATSISYAAKWAETPAGASSVARENMIAAMNRRPARTAAELFADSEAGEARHASAAPIVDAQAATAAVLAREARAEMIADMNRDRSREATR